MNDSDRQAQECLEKGMAPRCPDFCVSDHTVAITEGCEPYTLYQHFGLNYGAGLFELVVPYDGRVIRPGRKGWSVGLEQTQSVRDGWDAMSWANVQIYDNTQDAKPVSLQMTSGELRDMAAALLKTADRMD